MASVPIQKDGMYHIASIEQGEAVRMSEDYFIEAQKDAAADGKDQAARPRRQGESDRGSDGGGGGH